MDPLDSQKKAMIAAFLFVLFIMSMMFGAYLSRGKIQQDTVFQSIPSPTEKQSTILAFSPATLNLKVGEKQTVAIILSGQTVQAADIVLSFDPTIISISQIQNGSVFERVIRKTSASGQVVYSGSVKPAQGALQTEGTVMTFTATAKKTGTSTISFDAKKTITALNGVNTVGTITSMTVEIQ